MVAAGAIRRAAGRLRQGAQRLTSFDRFNHTSCNVELADFLTLDDEVQEFVFCYVLRAANVATKHDATTW